MTVLTYFALFGGLFALTSRIMNTLLKKTQRFALENSMTKKLYTQVDENYNSQDIRVDESSH